MLMRLIAWQMVNRQRKDLPIEYPEQKHLDLTLPFPNDSFFFYGGNKEGNAFICRMAFRDPIHKIVQSLAEADQLEEGEIMVASLSDIGWTPYYSIISGLITEIGSLLSHCAVVAREYGIPAIVGAKGARKFLKNGDMVLLDGDRGIIELIEN